MQGYVFRGEGVAIASFLDSGVGTGSSAWVEAFEEFIDRSLMCPGHSCGGKIPQGR